MMRDSEESAQAEKHLRVQEGKSLLEVEGGGRRDEGRMMTGEVGGEWRERLWFLF